MALIDAYRKDTGQKVRIPARWIGHPVLGRQFAKTPRQKAEDRAVTAKADKAATPTTTPAAGDTPKGK